MKANFQSGFVTHSLVISLLLPLLFLIMNITFIKYDYAFIVGDLRYIQQAEEFSNGDFLNPCSTSINPPIYPLFLFLISKIVGLSPQIIYIFQAILLSFTVDMFLKEAIRGNVINKKQHIWMFVFIFLNPVFYYLNDGGVFIEFFSAAIVFLCFGLYLRVIRVKSFMSMLLLSFSLAVLLLTRYETAILIGCFLIFMMKRGFSRIRILTILSFPIMFLMLNAIKNYYIYNEVVMTNYSFGTTLWAGYNKDCNWHSINDSNYKLILSFKYHREYESISKQSGDVRRVIRMDSLYKVIAMESFNESPFYKIATFPNNIAKLWIPPPGIDLYTGKIYKNCDFDFNGYFDNCRFTKTEAIANISYFGFHWIIIVMSLLSVVLSFRNVIVKEILFILLIYSMMYLFVVYSNSRFVFIIYPFCLTLSSLFLADRKILTMKP